MTWNKINTGGGGSDPNSHTHTNKTTLDKFGESGGKPTFNGSLIDTNTSGGSGGSTTSKLSGEIWACLGDSVTRGGYWDNSTGVEMVGTEVITYHQQIATKTGIIVENYGIGGTRLTDHGEGNGMSVRYATMRDDADIITVFGGINDYAWVNTVALGTFGSTDITTIHGAMKVIIEGILQKYPGKPFGFIIPFPFNEYKGVGTFKPYYDAMVQNLNYYAIPYCDLYKESTLNANVNFINQKYFKFNYGTTTGDKTHPNTIGHEIIARPIKSFLERIVG